MLEVYGKSTEIPDSLADVEVSIYGLYLIEACKNKDPWVDTAVENYLGTQKFIDDLQSAEYSWKNRLDCNDYWLQLECDNNRNICLTVDMDMKFF